MKAVKSIIKIFYFKIVIPIIYFFMKLLVKPEKDYVIIDNKGEKKLDESFLFLIKRIKELDRIEFFIYDKRENFLDDIRFLKEVSRSQTIFLCTFHKLIDNVKLKKTQRVINLWHGCGIFKKFGYASFETSWGGDHFSLRNRMFNLYKNTNIFTVSSPFCIEYYCNAIKKNSDVVQSLGISRTDCFFESSFLNESKNKLKFLISEDLSSKKIILYAPTFRGDSLKNTMYPDFLDLEKLYEEFSDEYILIIKHHPKILKQQEIPDEFKKFAFNLTELIGINELLPNADILISDYSSLIFEYSLFEKPMIFFAPDIDKYNEDRGFFINYFDMIPGPLCRSNEELINCIKGINNYEIKKIKDFKNKFMSSCDGKSTERLLKKIQVL